MRPKGSVCCEGGPDRIAEVNRMVLEFKEKMFHLNAGERCVVPKGIEHSCEDEATVMLMEIDGTLTPDNTGGTYQP